MTRTLASCLALVLLAPTTPASAQTTSPSALEASGEGWEDLLAPAGKELKGWTRGTIPPGGKLRAASQWSFDPATGILVCQGDGGHEWLRFDREVGDFVYHVEWRFTPVEGKKGYNSGIYARNSADARIWHQAQTGAGPKGFLFGESEKAGKLQRFNLTREVKDDRVKPPGAWNTFEITCRGKSMALWVNGAVVCTFADCEVPRGYVGLEAEGWRIEFRNVKLKTLP